jgi:hypothetical protein
MTRMGSVDVSSVERRDLGPSIQWHIIIICILASLVGRYNLRCCSEMTSQGNLFASVKCSRTLQLR